MCARDQNLSVNNDLAQSSFGVVSLLIDSLFSNLLLQHSIYTNSNLIQRFYNTDGVKNPTRILLYANVAYSFWNTNGVNIELPEPSVR